MSSVFGYATVVRTLQTGEQRFATLVHDKELDAKQVIILKKELPVNTKLYWEYDCRTKKTNWMQIE